MQGRAIENKYRNTVVCIDSYKEKILNGRLYNPYLDGEVYFHSTMEFIGAIENLLEQMDFPKAFEEKRTFAKQAKEGYVVQSCPLDKEGNLTTFELKIFFRQNTSWQGTLCWMEKGQEESFRSALELLILMDSALESIN